MRKFVDRLLLLKKLLLIMKKDPCARRGLELKMRNYCSYAEQNGIFSVARQLQLIRKISEEHRAPWAITEVGQQLLEGLRNVQLEVSDA